MCLDQRFSLSAAKGKKGLCYKHDDNFAKAERRYMMLSFLNPIGIYALIVELSFLLY
jgi:hypothetical protein